MSLSRRDLLHPWRRSEAPAGPAMPAASMATPQTHGVAPLRPPGALPELSFLDACQRCGRCVEVCPRGAVHPLGPELGAAAGTPFIVPRSAPCVLCTGLQCTTVCPSGALRPVSLEQVRMGLAVVDPEGCLPHHGVACTSCVAVCPVEGALRLERGVPVVAPERCTGCGLCEEICPVEPSAVMIHPYR